VPSCWHVCLIGMLPLLAKAVLVNWNGLGSPPPANLRRSMTLSMVPGVPPFLSLLVEVSHRPPSGVLTTVRSRPQRPLKKARGLYPRGALGNGLPGARVPSGLTRRILPLSELRSWARLLVLASPVAM